MARMGLANAKERGTDRMYPITPIFTKREKERIDHLCRALSDKQFALSRADVIMKGITLLEKSINLNSDERENY